MTDPIETLAGTRATRRERYVASAIVGILVALSITAVRFARVELPAMTPFLPMFGMLGTSADLLTAVLLFSQARVARSAPLLVLAAAYMYSAFAIVAHILVFPGVFSSTGLFGASSQTMMWLWVAWHGGFPLVVLAYAATSAWKDAQPLLHVSIGQIAALVAGAAGVVLVTTVLVLHFDRSLPTLVAEGHPGLLLTSHVGLAVAGVIALVLVALTALTRLKTVANLWLAVALLSSLFDVVISTVSCDQFTLGWYVSRLMSLSTSMVVLVTFLFALGSLFNRLARFSLMDGLTGLSNRRAFDEVLAVQVDLARRSGQPLSLLLMDVDWFKKYNDTYGHPEGDQALRMVARAIRAVLTRRTDMGARYGGEEFVCILPTTNAEGARRIAQRIGNHVRHYNVPHSASDYGVLTLSLGVSTLMPGTPEAEATPALLLQRADAALYSAKKQGRDRVVHESDVSLDGIPEYIPSPQTNHVDIDVVFEDEVDREEPVAAFSASRSRSLMGAFANSL
jgi:diguanylate cyclase (GGDEF)-like protein